MAEGENPRTTVVPLVLGALLLILTQYVITQWVYRFGSDDALVSRVNFAGTIISSILAVLAIVYAFYQSFAQERSSSTLSHQLSELQSVVKRLRKSNQSLLANLTALTTMQAKLDASLELGTAAQGEFSKLHASFGEMKALVADVHAKNQELGDSSSGSDRGAHIAPERIHRVLRRATPIQLAFYLVLVSLPNTQVSYRDAFDDAFRAVFRERGFAEVYQRYLAGYFHGVYYLLQDFGMLSFGDSAELVGQVDPIFRTEVLNAGLGTEADPVYDEDFVALIAAAKAYVPASPRQENEPPISPEAP